MEKISSLFLKSNNILLITHENPDGDALGSMLGLREVLKNLGKDIHCVCSDLIPRPFLFLPGIDLVKKDFFLGDYDLIAILDCGDLRRTGFSNRLKDLSKYKNKIVNIDHHPKNDLHRLAKLNLIDFEASSTSEIIYELLREMKVQLNHLAATCILCGIYTDTGFFQHSNTSAKVLNIASELLKRGARLKEITKNIANNKTIAALRLWGLVLSRIRRNQKYNLITAIVTQKDMEECGANQADLAGVVNMINSIPGSRAAILFYEMPDGNIKASLRTEDNNVDISALARIFGGGGLKKASGFTIEGKIQKTRNGWQIKK